LREENERKFDEEINKENKEENGEGKKRGKKQKDKREQTITAMRADDNREGRRDYVTGKQDETAGEIERSEYGKDAEYTRAYRKEGTAKRFASVIPVHLAKCF